MSEPFFDYIHDSGKQTSRQLYGFEEREKYYERLEYIALPELTSRQLDLVQALQSRRTERNLGSMSLSLGKLSDLLLLSLAKREENEGDKHYSFPSGGGFYPLETYLYIQKVEGLVPGLYHYSSLEHSLALIDAVELSLEELNSIYKAELESIPSVTLFMTLVKSRIISKYGNLAYKLGLIEAGHRGQNLCLVASATNLATCSLGGGDSDRLHGLLGIDGVNEHHVYALAIGANKMN